MHKMMMVQSRKCPDWPRYITQHRPGRQESVDCHGISDFVNFELANPAHSAPLNYLTHALALSFKLANPLTSRLLGLAAGNNGGPLAELVVNLAAFGADRLQRLDNPHRLLVSNLAEDDVATIKPRGDDGGDEELRAVAAERERKSQLRTDLACPRAGISYVFLPALAMDSRPGLSCLSLKFSSANFSP